METSSGGFDSLMNESRYTYKRGQTIKYTDRFGKEQKGKYVMASSAEGYIVLNAGGPHGRPVVVHEDSIKN